jgi:rubrerythrin
VGGRSRVAAQLLAGKGFKEVYNLQGGMRAWNGAKAFGPKELNMELLRGDETPAEITLFAYGMETALGRFYSVMSGRTEDKELGELFSKLAKIEQRHREMVFSLYRSIEASGMDLPSFESSVNVKVMEGGFDIEAFLKENEPHMKTVPDALNVAMMIETQAMDLYLRYADKSTEVSTKDVLFKIAEEEKAHLGLLGQLMGERV